jgi:hypothetical protein
MIDNAFPFGGSPDKGGEVVLGLTGVYLSKWIGNRVRHPVRGQGRHPARAGPRLPALQPANELLNIQQETSWTMKNRYSHAASSAWPALLAALALPALAQNAEEAALKDGTLTPYGAERAANKDKTIPAWDGKAVAVTVGRQLQAARPLRRREAAPDHHRRQRRSTRTS